MRAKTPTGTATITITRGKIEITMVAHGKTMIEVDIRRKTGTTTKHENKMIETDIRTRPHFLIAFTTTTRHVSK